MAEGRTEEAVDRVTGFENHDTEVLLKIRQGMLGGLDKVGQKVEFDEDEIVGMGTVLERPKLGAANALEAGQTIVMIFDTITMELRQRGVVV